MRASLALIAILITGVAVAAVASGHPSEPGERYVSAEWQTDPNEGGRKIVVRWMGKAYACQYRFHRVAVRETDEYVRIKVLLHRRNMREGEACIAIATGGTEKVKLQRPLGDRELRHAPVTDYTYDN